MLAVAVEDVGVSLLAMSGSGFEQSSCDVSSWGNNILGSSGSGSSDSLEASWNLVAADDMDSRPELLLRQRLFSDGKSEKLVAMSLMSSSPRSDEKWLVTPLSTFLREAGPAVTSLLKLKGLMMPSLTALEHD